MTGRARHDPADHRHNPRTIDRITGISAVRRAATAHTDWVIDSEARAGEVALSWWRSQSGVDAEVCAVSDLGDAWRVFYAGASSLGELMLSQVPLLVDKATAAVSVDWPLRRETRSGTAQQAFGNIITEVSPKLHKLGFQGRGPGYRWSAPAHQVVLAIRRYHSSNAVVVRPFLSLAVVSHSKWAELRLDQPSLPRLLPPLRGEGIRGVWFTRFDLDRSTDSHGQWAVFAGITNSGAARRIEETVTERVLPAIHTRTQVA